MKDDTKLKLEKRERDIRCVYRWVDLKKVGSMRDAVTVQNLMSKIQTLLSASESGRICMHRHRHRLP